MLPLLKQIRCIRYLLVWKVNSSLVRIPDCLTVELSQVLGTIIAQGLPTKQAGKWQKAMTSKDCNSVIPPAGEVGTGQDNALDGEWPVESVLFMYPGKLTYGTEEVILWELRLFGDWADHGFFLEVILPAMEEASYTSDLRWNRRNGLWGHFDIYAAYVAQGRQWVPFVSEGKLDLRIRVSPAQWIEGLNLGSSQKHTFYHLSWLTPFSLEGIPLPADAFTNNVHTLSLKGILEVLIYRLSQLITGRYSTAEDVWNILTPQEQQLFHEAMEVASQPCVSSEDFKKPLPAWPGHCIGTQTFECIPLLTVPYLELASILHIGRHTHFGCGTFILT